jgi:hypothetical protein
VNAVALPRLKAPVPWFGGKSRAADLIWQAFGDVPNYVEPFFGSGAVLLARPHAPRVETVNDLDAYIANFWRATAADPEAVARHADAPVNEADLLVRQAEFRERVLTDPDYFDAKIAGWWVWGLCAWIGGGWCAIVERPSKRKPYCDGEGTGRGVHALGMRTHQKRPDLGAGGMGVHAPARKRPAIGGHMSNDGVGGSGAMLGVHANGMRAPSRQLPDLGGSTKGDATFANVGKGIHGGGVRSSLYDVFDALAARLRYVRVTCGDFERVLTPAVTWRHGLTSVLLDPPYPASAGRADKLYAHDSLEVAHRAASWAVEHWDDRLPDGSPAMRIAFCGYEGTHPELDASGWRSVRWKAKGGYGGQRRQGTNENADRETIWFSPHCLVEAIAAGPAQRSLFAAGGASVRPP